MQKLQFIVTISLIIEEIEMQIVAAQVKSLAAARGESPYFRVDNSRKPKWYLGIDTGSEVLYGS